MVNLDKLSQTHRKFTNGKEIQPIRVTEYDGKFYLRLDRNKNISRANDSGESNQEAWNNKMGCCKNRIVKRLIS